MKELAWNSTFKKNQDYGIWSHHFMANRRNKKWKQWHILFSWAAKSLRMVTKAMKLKTLAPWKESDDKPRSILRSRDLTLPAKVHVVKAMAFLVVMYGYEIWIRKKNWCSRTAVLEKTLESPLDSKEMKPVNSKGNQPWIFIGRTDTKLKLQYFGHLMPRADSLEKILMLGKTEGKRRRGQHRMRLLDSITDSMAMHLNKLQEIANDRET